MGERIGNLTRRESMSIFMAILLGLAAIFITAAASPITSASPQRGANATQATKGGNAAGGARGRAAASCADKTKRYTDCGDGTVAGSVTGVGLLEPGISLPPP